MPSMAKSRASSHETLWTFRILMPMDSSPALEQVRDFPLRRKLVADAIGIDLFKLRGTRGREHHVTRMYDLPEARSCLRALLPVHKPGSHPRLACSQRRKFQGVFGGLIFQVRINHLPQSPHAP